MMAWLAAVPKPPAGSRRAMTADTTARVSRLDRLKKAKNVPAMPPNPAPHIVARLLEIGISEPTDMGRKPLSWSELDAWCRRTKVDLDPWESRLLHALSQAYLTELNLAEEETRPPPWRGEVTRREIETEETRLRAVLG